MSQSKWEYSIVEAAKSYFTVARNADGSATLDAITDAEKRLDTELLETEYRFDALGAMGWELVTVHDGLAYFRRCMDEERAAESPMPTPTPTVSPNVSKEPSLNDEKLTCDAFDIAALIDDALVTAGFNVSQFVRGSNVQLKIDRPGEEKTCYCRLTVEE